MGAFGLNASIMDASNLAWKVGLVAQQKAKLESLMSTYSLERRDHACRIIETSGEYLRFVCATDLQIAEVRHLGTSPVASGFKSEVKDSRVNGTNHEATNGTKDSPNIDDDLQFLRNFFGKNGQFLLGVDAPFANSVLTLPQPVRDDKYRRPLRVNHGVRAPNPRVCFSNEKTGYLYDQMTGAATFHVVIFASSLSAAIRRKLAVFAAALLSHQGFYRRFGRSERFNILLVTKRLPWEVDELMSMPELYVLKQHATIIYDDRAPDEDAHTTWGVNHLSGGLAIVRPDLWVGITTEVDDVDDLSQYFESFLLPVD